MVLGIKLFRNLKKGVCMLVEGEKMLVNADADAVDEDEKKEIDVGGRRLFLSSNRLPLSCQGTCASKAESRLISTSRSLESGKAQLSCSMRRDNVQKQISRVFYEVCHGPDTAPLTISSIQHTPALNPAYALHLDELSLLSQSLGPPPV